MLLFYTSPEVYTIVGMVSENAYEIELAIDQIIKADPLNLYRKVKKTLPDAENGVPAA